MPATRELFTLLGDDAQTGGTWTYTGSVAPPPIAPPTDTGVADFSPVLVSGAFPFDYDVVNGTATDTKTVTVNYNLNISNPHDACATAKDMGIFLDPSAGGKVEDTITLTTGEDCIVKWKEATASGVTTPANWAVGTYKDIWIKLQLEADPTTAPYRPEVQIISDPLNSNALKYPVIAVYSDPLGTACGVITERDSNGQDGEYSASIGWWHNVISRDQVYLRISNGASGQTGEFTITVESTV